MLKLLNLQNVWAKSCREIVVIWLGLYFVSAKHFSCIYINACSAFSGPEMLYPSHVTIPTTLVVHEAIYGVIYAILRHAFCMTHCCQLLRY